jgi:peroxiredoxin
MTKVVDLPDMCFHVRKGGAWRSRHANYYFPYDKRVLLVTLKGAWINDSEAQFYDQQRLGFDSTVLLTVNDSFVQNAWANDLDLRYVRLLPDGNGCLAKALNLLIRYDDSGLRAYPSEWEVHNNKLILRKGMTCR